MFWIRLSGWVFILLLAATAAVMGLGSRLPELSETHVSEVVNVPPERLWRVLADVARQQNWRRELRATTLLPERGGHPCWQEEFALFTLPLCVTEDSPPRRRVLTSVDPRLPVTGTWTLLLAAQPGDRTEVILSGRRRTAPAMWRFAEHYLWGEERFERAYLLELRSAAEGATAGAESRSAQR